MTGPVEAAVDRKNILDWLGSLDLEAPISSNQPSVNVPFQRWFRFKEAYSPKLVLDVVDQLDELPSHVFDPFGGCGTSAITSQFLGIPSTVVEVNPFLADLTESKLCSYHVEKLKKYLSKIQYETLADIEPSLKVDSFPKTFCEPGRSGKWLYNKSSFKRILQYREAIERICDEKYRRFFTIILGSILVPISNIFISGKGRKYRQNWNSRQKSAIDVEQAFNEKAQQAISDVQKHSTKLEQYEILRGSCLDHAKNIDGFELSIFSPPYPNSFDYTDVYNVELWMLGYFKSNDSCKELRAKTLRSHVQVNRSYEVNFDIPKALDKVITGLKNIRNELWNKDIPEMVLAYFDDLFQLLTTMRGKISENGNIVIVVGDSAYKSIRIPVTTLLCELAQQAGFVVHENKVLRKLRTSPQQGGQASLDESMIWLKPELYD
ncbi:hypothetical protein [Idiomarina ramblicola]|uniref:DNA methylase N-4/N-6 domain-containing protein n=1 Tax=Idiomarina ramblicola TaxID=263724 RepID=A0A432Z0L2_9GAMM|nr:hypothetical protein [Idiomarina ramblicola]RUO69695.1 hypothetical protein CWI78_07150 [Idiomarina ramblicola]